MPSESSATTTTASVLAPRLMANEPAIGQRSTRMERARGLIGGHHTLPRCAVHERAANSGRSLSPFGERVGVRGLPAVFTDPNPLTHSFVLQKRVALSPLGRGHERQ